MENCERMENELFIDAPILIVILLVSFSSFWTRDILGHLSDSKFESQYKENGSGSG